MSTEKLNWSEVSAQMEALAEEFSALESEETEVNESEVEGEEDEVEVSPFTEAQFIALAEMLEIDPSDLVDLLSEADGAKEVMAYLGYKLDASPYGKPGLSGKFPWSKNEAPVGVATAVEDPAQTSSPGDATAKVPMQARMNKFMQMGVK